MKKRVKSLDRGIWRSAKLMGVVTALSLYAVTAAVPGQANNVFEDAHSLRSLDIMLMVTSLRCRTGPHDFQRDYRNFSAAHLIRLNAAGHTLRRSFAANYGEPNPERALDRMGVKIANSYGGGHPWLSCHELQREARELSQSRDASSLVRKARYLLSAQRPMDHHVPDRQMAHSKREQITYNMTADWEQRP